MRRVAWSRLTGKDSLTELVSTSLYSGPVASLRFMQACLPHMKSQKWGRIINTASAASRGRSSESRSLRDGEGRL